MLAAAGAHAHGTQPVPREGLEPWSKGVARAIGSALSARRSLLLTRRAAPHPPARRASAAAQSVRALTSPGGASTLVHNLDEAAMGEVLTALFEQADVSQSSSLPKSTVKRLLVDSEIGFSPKEVQCLISTADVDVDGAIMYHSLALEAHRQLAYLELQSSS